MIPNIFSEPPDPPERHRCERCGVPAVELAPLVAARGSELGGVELHHLGDCCRHCRSDLTQAGWLVA